jgi:Icc protein
VRILHVSDLHLRQHLPGSSAVRGRDSRRMPEILDQVVHTGIRLGADLGVLSGDLVDVPSGTAPDSAEGESAQRDLDIVVSVLGRTPFPWLVVPGNHDLEEQVLAAFAPQRDLRLGGYRAVAFVDQEEEGHVPRRVGRERALFECMLGTTGSCPQIHVQHYVLQPRLDASYPHTYQDGEALAEAVVSSGRVALVLSGHYHPGVPPFRLGDTWFSTAPALCEFPHTAMLYDLEHRELRWRRLEWGQGR